MRIGSLLVHVTSRHAAADCRWRLLGPHSPDPRATTERMTKDHGSELRSSSSDEPSCTVIVNSTKRTIDLVWLDYQGMEISYGLLESRKHFGTKTFVGHPWIFFLKDTRLRLNVCVPDQPPADVLWPQRMPTQVAAGKPKFNVAVVVFPVLSLRDICYQVLRDSCVTDDIVKQLYIPESLKADYREFRLHS